MIIMPKTIDHFIHEATKNFDETKSILTGIVQTLTDDGDVSSEDKILIIQLILQYRLSSEDALSHLLRMDHNLLYLLGVQPSHSTKMKMDRLSYAVGNEDLKQILNVLALLTGSLSKIIARHKSSHASFALKNKKPPKQHIVLREALKLTAKQKQVLEVLHQLELGIEQSLEFQAEAPVLDHISALRGPISQFHQAVIFGLEQGEFIYQQLNKTPLLDYQLNSLLKETEQVLHLMPSIYNPQPHKPIKQFDQQITSEELEQRAAAKRLRPFFG